MRRRYHQRRLLRLGLAGGLRFRAAGCRTNAAGMFLSVRRRRSRNEILRRWLQTDARFLGIRHFRCCGKGRLFAKTNLEAETNMEITPRDSNSFRIVGIQTVTNMYQSKQFWKVVEITIPINEEHDREQSGSWPKSSSITVEVGIIRDRSDHIRDDDRDRSGSIGIGRDDGRDRSGS